MQYYEEQAAVALPYASWLRRITSAVIDVFVLAALSAPFVASVLGDLVRESADLSKATAGQIRTLTVVGIVMQVAYFTAMHAWRGASLGKMATRTIVVRDDGSELTPGVAFTRAVTLVGINFLSSFLVAAPAIVNMLRPIWSPRRQTWHDQVARTVVVHNSPR